MGRIITRELMKRSVDKGLKIRSKGVLLVPETMMVPWLTILARLKMWGCRFGIKVTDHS